jgi:plastocyanin
MKPYQHMLKMIAALALFLVAGVGISNVFGEDYQIEVSETGFEHSYLAINSGDTVTFVNVHYVTDVNLEPHCISDPFAQPYTELSYWQLTDQQPTRTYTLTSGQTFYDRCFTDFSPVVVEVTGTETSSDTDMDTAPDYTGDTDVIALQADLAEVTLDLTNALSTIGTLQTQVADLQSESLLLIQANTDLQTQLTNSVVDVSPYTDQIDLLVEERDQWKQLAENWYAVALEQVRVMVEVLGL